MSWIQTFTDGKFDLLEPKVDQVDIRVIAHALARICRFGGHSRQFYSVAQHSVIVSQLVPVPYALHGLLHDAAEAYIGDVVRPLKQILNVMSDGHYRVFESRVEEVIWTSLGLRWTDDATQAVRRADEQALANEAACLFGKPVDQWTEKFPPPMAQRSAAVAPEIAELGFLARYVELTAPIARAQPPGSKSTADLSGAVVEAPPANATRLTQLDVREAIANSSVIEPMRVDDGRPLSRLAHEIRIELLADSLTRAGNTTIKQRICEIYSAGDLNSAEASYLQEVVALNIKRFDRFETIRPETAPAEPAPTSGGHL